MGLQSLQSAWTSNRTSIYTCQRQVRPLQSRPILPRRCLAQRPTRAGAERDGVYDVVSNARQKVVRAQNPSSRNAAGPLKDFLTKFRLAWSIFFPAQPPDLSPKDEGKHRLRMILVADRCGMNQASLYEMKHSIVKVVQDYVDIEGEELVEVNVTMDPDMGTIYSVAVPVKRVKPQARLPTSEGALDVDGITLEWDAGQPADAEADPSARFPYGC